MAIGDPYFLETKPDTIDLKNVPREAVTVTVTVTDEKYKTLIENRISGLKETIRLAKEAESYQIAARCTSQLQILNQILLDAER